MDRKQTDRVVNIKLIVKDFRKNKKIVNVIP